MKNLILGIIIGILIASLLSQNYFRSLQSIIKNFLKILSKGFDNFVQFVYKNTGFDFNKLLAKIKIEIKNLFQDLKKNLEIKELLKNQ
ncbi:MAG: hypothetical protein C4348_01180 [Patescibacteria group bacterium]